MICLDSGAIVAYFHENDPFHEAALRGFAGIEGSGVPVFTTSLCVAEAVSVFAQRSGDCGRAARAGLEILGWDMEVVRPTLADERRALKLMESYARRGVGFVDCLSFVVMDARSSRTAFTFDREHFVRIRKLATLVPIPSQ